MHAAHDGGRHRLCVDWAGGDACVRVFASGTRFLEGPGKEMLGKGTKEGTCSLSDAGGNVQGEEMLGKGGQRKEHARLVTRVEMCAGKKCSQMCQRALTQKQTLWGRVAHFSEVTALSLSASHSLVMPSAV